MPATATVMTERRSRMKYWFAYVGTALGLWVAVVFGFGILAQVLHQWHMAVVMILGSMVAGSTPMGGGAVSFPFLALWEGIPPDNARNFALAIQSLGMTSAMVFILCRRVVIQTRLLAWTAAGAALGMFIGTVAIAPRIGPGYVKLLFACVWMSFGILTVARNREFCSLTGFRQPGRAEAARVGLAVGLIGGVIASIIGVGVEMALYTVLVLLYRCDLKIAVPTAVSAMALASVMGVSLHLARGDIGRDVVLKFLAAAPIVIFGAPIGTWIVSVIPRIRTLYVVSALCLIQFLWTLSRAERTTAELAFVAVAMTAAGIGFYAMYRRGRRVDQGSPQPEGMVRIMSKRLLPLGFVALLIAAWQFAVGLQAVVVIPGPLAVVKGIAELAYKGLLVKYIVASLFRVTWGYLLAVLLAIPFGLMLGWYRRGEMAVNPLLQTLRPISALAWIPISILWFGVGDLAAVFLIFVASFLPLTVSAMNAVRNIPEVFVNAGRNFGLSEPQLVYKVLYPAVMPQLLVALRITLGIAWLVVVAAEMIAVNSGLGFLIVDSRNAGNRYDLVIAGMVLIGVIGLLLDVGMRGLERLKSLRWGYGEQG